MASAPFTDLLLLLAERFHKNLQRHDGLAWPEILSRLEANEDKLNSLRLIEQSGGGPDVIGYDPTARAYLFCDCSPESPAGRRSLCYDQRALALRKEHKPKGSAVGMAQSMGGALFCDRRYDHVFLYHNGADSYYANRGFRALLRV